MSPYAFLKGKNLIKNGKNARRKECSAYAIVCRYLMDISYLAENSINYEFGASSLPSCLFGDNPYIIAKNTQERMAPKNAAPIKLRNNSR